MIQKQIPPPVNQHLNWFKPRVKTFPLREHDHVFRLLSQLPKLVSHIIHQILAAAQRLVLNDGRLRLWLLLLLLQMVLRMLQSIGVHVVILLCRPSTTQAALMVLLSPRVVSLMRRMRVLTLMAVAARSRPDRPLLPSRCRHSMMDLIGKKLSVLGILSKVLLLASSYRHTFFLLFPLQLRRLLSALLCEIHLLAMSWVMLGWEIKNTPVAVE